MNLQDLITTQVDNEILLNTNMGELYKNIYVYYGFIIIGQLYDLLMNLGYTIPVTEISVFDNESAADLADVFTSNQSNKSQYANYPILYSYILNALGKQSPINILEFGLDQRPGGSLYAFREYLPNANMCGTSPDAEQLFESDRIKTLCVDQYDLVNFLAIPRTLENRQFDLIIENGDDSITTLLNTITFSLNNLNKNGWIVIENVRIKENWKYIDYLLNESKLYETFMVPNDKKLYMYTYIYAIHKLP